VATRSAHIARGTFEVEIAPWGKEDRSDGNVLGFAVVTKRFAGDLEGNARGRMSTARTAVRGSAGYVMIERVRGRLEGRSGSFLFQHTGTLDRGAAVARIEIVPDSGTGALAGLAGRLSIRITKGRHEYELRYTLPRRRSSPRHRV
jgi:Protein of unknown function (DUF3224)